MRSAKHVFYLFALCAVLIVTYTLFGRKMVSLYKDKPGYLVPEYLVEHSDLVPEYLVKHSDLVPEYLVEHSDLVPKYLVPEYLVEHSDELCGNILDNITDGKWARKIDLITNKSSLEYRQLVEEEEKFDAHMNEFRIRRGIHVRLWRDDLKCGINSLQKKPQGSDWAGSIGAWCDKKSDKPCCSDEGNGICGMECECPRCIDMRKYYHAEFSEWIPTDAKCVLRNYTATRQCDVIRRFSQITFVGDSFVRKMARGFILLLRSNPTNGATAKMHKDDRRKLCVGTEQFYWSKCGFGNGGFDKTMVDDSPLCDMDLKNFAFYEHYSIGYATPYLNLVKQLAGKVGTVIFLGVGGHDGCNAKLTWEKYVNPGVQYLNEFYKNGNDGEPQKWPRVVFMFSDTPGVLKSRDFRAQNGKVPCYKFADQMSIYCKAHGIDVLDFRKLTSGVQSFDGTHHGLGVNLMKNRLLLNYLDSISTYGNWTKS